MVIGSVRKPIPKYRSVPKETVLQIEHGIQQFRLERKDLCKAGRSLGKKSLKAALAIEMQRRRSDLLKDSHDSLDLSFVKKAELEGLMQHRDNLDAALLTTICILGKMIGRVPKVEKKELKQLIENMQTKSNRRKSNFQLEYPRDWNLLHRTPSSR